MIQFLYNISAYIFPYLIKLNKIVRHGAPNSKYKIIIAVFLETPAKFSDIPNSDHNGPAMSEGSMRSDLSVTL